MQPIRLNKAHQVPISAGKINEETRKLTVELELLIISSLRDKSKSAKTKGLFNISTLNNRNINATLKVLVEELFQEKIPYVPSSEIKIHIDRGATLIRGTIRVGSISKVLAIARYTYNLQRRLLIAGIPCSIYLDLTRRPEANFSIEISIYGNNSLKKLDPASSFMGIKNRIQKFEQDKSMDLHVNIPNSLQTVPGSPGSASCISVTNSTCITSQILDEIDVAPPSVAIESPQFLNSLDVINPVEMLLYTEEVTSIFKTLKRISTYEDIHTFYIA